MFHSMMWSRWLRLPRLAAGPCGARLLHSTIRELAGKPVGEPVQVRGWVLSVRPQKRIAFIDVTDGTTVRALQVVTSDPAVKAYAPPAPRPSPLALPLTHLTLTLLHAQAHARDEHRRDRHDRRARVADAADRSPRQRRAGLRDMPQRGPPPLGPRRPGRDRRAAA